MSWLVQTLLINSLQIKTIADIESDDFNDLLIVEKGIEYLSNFGLFSEKESSILYLVQDGKNIRDAASILGISRATARKLFESACGKLSNHLGDGFTDDGFVSNVIANNRLAEDDAKKLHQYMTSNMRHRLLRRSFE